MALAFLAIVGLVFGSAVYWCVKTCPDEKSFYRHLQTQAERTKVPLLGMIKGVVDRKIFEIAMSADVVRYVNYGVFSAIAIKDNNGEFSEVIALGMLGHWVLRKEMEKLEKEAQKRKAAKSKKAK